MSKDKGTLSQMDEFLSDPNYSFEDKVEPAPIADVIRVHDYNYLG